MYWDRKEGWEEDKNVTTLFKRLRAQTKASFFTIRRQICSLTQDLGFFLPSDGWVNGLTKAFQEVLADLKIFQTKCISIKTCCDGCTRPISRCRPSQGSHRREPIPSVSTLVTICISNIGEEFLAMLVALIVTGQSVVYNMYF